MAKTILRPEIFEATMQCSHMTNREAVALAFVLSEVRIPRDRQMWRSAQTRDNDHTCEIVAPTPDEVKIIAHLMKSGYCVYDPLLGAMVAQLRGERHK